MKDNSIKDIQDNYNINKLNYYKTNNFTKYISHEKHRLSLYEYLNHLHQNLLRWLKEIHMIKNQNYVT